MTDSALIDLETKVAYLEQNLQELSDVIISQQKEIDSLTKNQSALIEKLAALINDEEIDPGFEKPPHY